MEKSILTPFDSVQPEAAMSTSTTGPRTQSLGELPRSLPDVKLHHGEALWVLARLGFQGGASRSTFYEYIKSLRKLGTPFERGKLGFARRGLANYSYCHLMELALALTLRVYHAVPDAVLVEIIRNRATLYRLYRRAYAERCTGVGAPISVKGPGHAVVHLRGAFLDLKMNFSGGRLVSFGPPKLLSPFQALRTFAERDMAARPFLPINLALISERLILEALRVPHIRRGSRSTVKRRNSASIASATKS
jgi:hypothetical protein